MNRDDLDIVKNLLDELDSSRNLSQEEKNLLDIYKNNAYSRLLL